MKLNTKTKQLLNHLISPEQFDFWSRELGSTVAWNRVMARVVERRQESTHTLTLCLQANDNFAGFEAGQHVNVMTVIGGKRISRSYTISNIPASSGQIEITVRRDRNGLMSNWLHQQAQVGQIIELGQVFGELTLDAIATENSEVDIAMLAAGSGITPMISLIREMAQRGFQQRTVLLYWDHSQADFCFTEELESLAKKQPLFSVQFITTRPQSSLSTPSSVPPKITSGRINQQQIEEYLPQIDNSTILACGGSEFVSRAQVLTAKAKAFHAEAFTPHVPAASDEPIKTVTIELQASGRKLEVSNRDNLLEVLESQGVAVDSGCRMGICNTCSCLKVQGSTKDTITGESEHNADSAIRLCVSRATSDLKLAL